MIKHDRRISWNGYFYGDESERTIYSQAMCLGKEDRYFVKKYSSCMPTSSFERILEAYNDYKRIEEF